MRSYVCRCLPVVILPWANLLTASRVVIAPACAWACWQGHWLLAAVLFTLAALSDYYDGPLARAHGQSSNWGGLFDHATDAWFVALTLSACATNGSISPWLPPLVVMAFAQYTLDSSALAGARLRANWLGRSNGIAYYVLAGVAIGLALLQPWLSRWLPAAWFTQVPYALSWLLILSTAASMLNRFVTWWGLPRDAQD